MIAPPASVQTLSSSKICLRKRFVRRLRVQTRRCRDGIGCICRAAARWEPGDSGAMCRCSCRRRWSAGRILQRCEHVENEAKLVRGVTPGDWAAFGRDESGAFAVPDQFFRLLRVGALIRGMRCCLFGSARSGETVQRGAGLQKPAVDWACADLQVCSNSRFCPNRCSCSNPQGLPGDRLRGQEVQTIHQPQALRTPGLRGKQAEALRDELGKRSKESAIGDSDMWA